MENNGDSYSQCHYQHSQHIQREASFLKGREKSRSYLQTDRVDKQNQSELFQEVEQVLVQIHVEMTEYDSDKEYPGNSQRYSPHFDFCKDDSKRYG